VTKISKPKWPFVIIAFYLLAVVVCIFLAFDFDGRINTTWTLAVIVLTLPWSFVTVIFTWSLIHGAGLEFFTVMYLVFAGINSLLFYWLYSILRAHSARV
jgi:hypothetical protein